MNQFDVQLDRIYWCTRRRGKVESVAVVAVRERGARRVFGVVRTEADDYERRRGNCQAEFEVGADKLSTVTSYRGGSR
jgi:hypothetical protein